LQRILAEDFEEFPGPGSQSRGGELLRVPPGLGGKDEPPAYHFRWDAHLGTGVAIPSRMDSRIPGMESRYNVSWIDRQSCSDTRTALPRRPVMRTGSREAVTSSRSRYSRSRAWLAVMWSTPQSYDMSYDSSTRVGTQPLPDGRGSETRIRAATVRERSLLATHSSNPSRGDRRGRGTPAGASRGPAAWRRTWPGCRTRC